MTASGPKTYMNAVQKVKLKDYLMKPIKHFDLIIDDSKISPVWYYFGELCYKDPISRDIHVIDTGRQYCLECIKVAQSKDPLTSFERSGICFFSRSTGTRNKHDHLKIRHQIDPDAVQYNENPGSHYVAIEPIVILDESMEGSVPDVANTNNDTLQGDGNSKEDGNSKVDESIESCEASKNVDDNASDAGSEMIITGDTTD